MTKTKSASSRSGSLNIVIAIFGGVLLVVCLGGIILALHLLGFFGNAQTGLNSSVPDNQIPPEALAARHEKEAARLNSYGWIDKEAGVVTIPISQAMLLIADTGLPVGEPTATPTLIPIPTPDASEAPAPTAEPTATPTVDLANVSFAQNVLPIFEQHCQKCHGEEEPKEGLTLTSHAEVMAGSMNGSVIEPGDVENSYLIEQIVSGRMPKEGPKLTPAEIEVITAWVEAGAPDN